jgi:hypothetical protein
MGGGTAESCSGLFRGESLSTQWINSVDGALRRFAKENGIALYVAATFTQRPNLSGIRSSDFVARPTTAKAPHVGFLKGSRCVKARNCNERLVAWGEYPVIYTG